MKKCSGGNGNRVREGEGKTELKKKRKKKRIVTRAQCLPNLKHASPAVMFHSPPTTFIPIFNEYSPEKCQTYTHTHRHRVLYFLLLLLLIVYFIQFSYNFLLLSIKKRLLENAKSFFGGWPRLCRRFVSFLLMLIPSLLSLSDE